MAVCLPSSSECWDHRDSPRCSYVLWDLCAHSWEPAGTQVYGAGWALPCASPSLHSAPCSSRGALPQVMCMGILLFSPQFLSFLPAFVSAGSPRFVPTVVLSFLQDPSGRDRAWLLQEAMTRVLADVGRLSGRQLDPERGVSSRTMSQSYPPPQVTSAGREHGHTISSTLQLQPHRCPWAHVSC